MDTKTQYTIIDSGAYRKRTAYNHLRAAELYARTLYPAKRYPFMYVRRISGKPQGDGQFEPVLNGEPSEPFIVQKGGA